MPFLMRLELPDVRGSLGRVASAIGEAGGDIEAIQVVDKSADGFVIDDVLLELEPGRMPDSIVSACSQIDGVRVLWISRYAAGGNLFLDLELVEEISADPERAFEKMLDLIPVTFRVDWAVRARRAAEHEDGTAVIVASSGAAPEAVEWVDVERASRVESWDENQVLCAVPLAAEIMLLGRRGGPEFLDQEVARIEHLVGLTASINRVHRANAPASEAPHSSVPDSML